MKPRLKKMTQLKNMIFNYYHMNELNKHYKSLKINLTSFWRPSTK